MGLYDGLRDAANVLKEANKIEQYKEILEAQKELLDMQKRISDLESENKDLKDKLETKGKLVYQNDTYVLVEDDKEDGPFCSRCWDVERRLVRTHPMGNPAFHKCPECNSEVQVGLNRINNWRQPPYENPER